MVGGGGGVRRAGEVVTGVFIRLIRFRHRIYKNVKKAKERPYSSYIFAAKPVLLRRLDFCNNNIFIVL